ncbi:hypothetical protein XENOCAPTIV_000613, partial [Xenoophorus captivus]
WNPHWEHLHSFTLCTHTMLICFSLSPFVFIFTSCHSCGRACACKLSLSVTRRETDGSRIKARVCFGKLRVGAVTRCKNNVIIEAGLKAQLLLMIVHTQPCRAGLLCVSVTCVFHCTFCT